MRELKILLRAQCVCVILEINTAAAVDYYRYLLL